MMLRLDAYTLVLARRGVRGFGSALSGDGVGAKQSTANQQRGRECRRRGSFSIAVVSHRGILPRLQSVARGYRGRFDVMGARTVHGAGIARTT